MTMPPSDGTGAVTPPPYPPQAVAPPANTQPPPTQTPATPPTYAQPGYAQPAAAQPVYAYPPPPVSPQPTGFTVPAGYQLPRYSLAPYYLTKRIPEDQPYTLRSSVGKRLLQFGSVGVFVVLIFGCVMAGAAFDGDGGVAIVLGALMVLMLGTFVAAAYSVSSGGPVLAVGPHGLWVKTRPSRGQAIWLPWEAIELVDSRRWGVEKSLRIRPRDPRITGNLGAYTAFDSSMQRLFFGAGFLATLSFSDRPQAQTIAAIRYFSAGRCYVNL